MIGVVRSAISDRCFLIHEKQCVENGNTKYLHRALQGVHMLRESRSRVGRQTQKYG